MKLHGALPLQALGWEDPRALLPVPYISASAPPNPTDQFCSLTTLVSWCLFTSRMVPVVPHIRKVAECGKAQGTHLCGTGVMT